MRPLRQPVYVILGTMFLLLGALGLFLPLLPTTPFWLLTCWFYLRGSNRLYARVMRNPYFGGYMRGFLEEKAIPLHGKIVTVVVMWGSAISTFLFLDVHWAILGDQSADPGGCHRRDLVCPLFPDRQRTTVTRTYVSGLANVCVGDHVRTCEAIRTYVSEQTIFDV